ncbi:hypothetical protein [Actinomadura rubrisoli]|uniref:Uncharacterized protein n=1 Tax=Actinomadura rubrisoli TaxID=2530368 RepID=A0A4R5B3R4_9ACTN|nr:hypothetical protein [Actinomadura rubrisoli]TDD79855.1 hypothetical protein E1298_26915 [Actinomadura rubrisoli]
MGWHAGRQGLAVLLFSAILTLWSTSAHADPAADARTVYCVRPENHKPLVDAAVALGLARKGGSDGALVPSSGAEVTVEQWKGTGAFQQACAALVAARKLPRTSPSKPWWETLWDKAGGILAVVVGALLTLWATLVTGRKTVVHQMSSGMFTAASDYYHACRDCLDAWEENRDADVAQEAMASRSKKLQAVLQQNRRRHPGWSLLGAAGADVRKLDEQIAKRRNTEIQESRDALDGIYDRLLTLSNALEHPWRNWRRVRAP